MSCFRPLTACRTPAGEVKIGLNRGDAYPLQLPCGRCVGCRMDNARAWSTRIMHEASLYGENRFVTLTYDDEHLPEWADLEYPHFQRFMRDVRRDIGGADRRMPVRFFCGGEYGRKNGRPHWHAILFNVALPDEVVVGEWRVSAALEKVWKRGFVSIGDVTAESAKYVAGYTQKKVYGRNWQRAYEIVNSATGEVRLRRREFCKMSLKPGIGSVWYEKFGADVFPEDRVFGYGGRRSKVPRFYWKRFEAEADAGLLEEVKERRYQRAMERREDSTPERCAIREEYALRKEEFFSPRDL